VSGSNEQRSRRHGKENQDLSQDKEVVERRHQRKKEDGQEREKVKMALRGGCPGTGRAPALDPADEEKILRGIPD
jgi:hypothetical protein